MKKGISILLSLSMVAGLFTGCSLKNGSTNATDPNTIVIWHDKEEAVSDILLKKLETLGPDIHIVLEKKSDLTESLKMVGNNPNAAPDMYFFAHDKIGVYAEMDILAPITDIIDGEQLDGYMDKTLEAATYKGEIYQLPIYYETLLFMYNRRYMSDDEVPKTTEELYSYMERTTKGGHYGFVEQHSTPYYAAGWINGFGGNILNENAEPELDSKEVMDALEYHKKFTELMPGETEYATVNTLFKEGMAHATIGGPWLIPTVKQSGMDVGVAPMPTIDPSGQPISPYMGVQGVHVLKIAAQNKKETVRKVLQVIMDENLQIELANATGCAPALESCYEKDAIKNDEIVMAMKETAEHAVPMSNMPEMDVMWTVVGNLLTDINMSGKDVKESADKAQKEAKQLIKNMK